MSAAARRPHVAVARPILMLWRRGRWVGPQSTGPRRGGARRAGDGLPVLERRGEMMRRGTGVLVGGVAAILVTLGCADATGVYAQPCTRELRTTLELHVRDAETGSVPEFTATPVATLSSGSLRATMDYIPGPASRDGAPEFVRFSYAPGHERPGTYAVTLVAPGYQSWAQSGIVVPLDGCHVRGVTVDVALVR